MKKISQHIYNFRLGQELNIYKEREKERKRGRERERERELTSLAEVETRNPT